MAYPQQPGYDPADQPYGNAGHQDPSPWAGPQQQPEYHPRQPYPEHSDPDQAYPTPQYSGQQYSGQQYADRQYPAQSYPPAPTYPPAQDYRSAQSYQDQGYQGQGYQDQSYQGQVYQDQSYQGQGYPNQTYPNQTYPGQTYPGQQYGAYPPAPANRMSRGLKVLLITLPVILIFGAGAFAAVHLSSDNNKQQPTASETQSSTPSAKPAAAASLDRFAIPAKVGGMPKSTNKQLTDAAKQLNGSLGKDVTGSVSEVYQSTTNPTDIFFLIAAPMADPIPAVALAASFAALGTVKEYKLGKPTKYSTGTKGGMMECADGSISADTTTLPVAICVVADGGGLILTMYFSHTKAQTASLTKTVRKTFEK